LGFAVKSIDGFIDEIGVCHSKARTALPEAGYIIGAHYIYVAV
jgi:hypothetical protein